MSVLTKDLIKSSEERAVKSGAFSFKELMLNAGTLAAKEIEKLYDIKNKNIAVVCGKGNNGGDGCVIAEYLKEKEANVTVITPFNPPETENAKYYYNKLTTDKADTLSGDFDFIIDAIFGIGYRIKADNRLYEIIGKINESSAIKISVDIPSGVECDNGKVGETAVKADLTLTFIALKPCFVLPKGSDYCGKVKVLDIGVAPIGQAFEVIKEPVFKERSHNAHKGTFGTGLLICGSYGMAGAAMLSAKAALRSGLGIAKCLIPKSIYFPFTIFLPEAVCVPSKQTKTGILKFNKHRFNKLINNCSAVLFGCGSGQGNETLKIIDFLLKNTDKPLVIDADGINALASNIELLRKCKAPIIITPHPGEMARLCKTTTEEIESDRPRFAMQFAEKYGCTVVLKGSNTLVAEPNGKLSVNINGNFGLATGGSGDVLAGITVSLLAQGYSAAESAKMAVYLHSLAADKTAAKRSRHALLPTDIIEEL